MILLATPLALAGYGDPVDGYPSRDERLLHLWTNAARVDPEAFEEDYAAGGCSTAVFSEDELTPKPPVYIDLDLNEVARVHSVDMAENGCFQHESCDGTDTWTRIAGYYDDTTNLGENIAMGSSDMRYAVMSMWMCSDSGHRANIMSGDWNELGAGVESIYQTQDFAQGLLELGQPPVRMAADDAGTFYADWGDDAAPGTLAVVIDGVDHPMELAWGVDDQGVYRVEIDGLDESTCAPWYVYWATAKGVSGTFPEEGSWLVGDGCTADDEGAGWIAEQTPRGGLFGDVEEDDLGEKMLEDVSLTGCAVVPGASGALVVLIAAGFVVRRRG